MTPQIGTVCLVSPRYEPAIGGVETHVGALARGLVKHGLSVEVVTTDPTNQLQRTDMIDGVQVRRFPTVGNDSVFFLSPWLGAWLGQHARSYDVLHAHSYHTPLALQAARAARRWQVPLVLTPHYHGTGHSTVRRWLHIPYRLPGKWLVHQAQTVICVSGAERDLVRRHFGADIPIEVIPNGIDVNTLLAAKPHPKRDGAVTLLTVGRLESYKQVDRLIRTLPLLPAHYEAVIIGDGAARTEIEQTAAQLGVENRTRLLGHVSQDELLAWYRSADVFVSLSRHESFGITVLEGAAGGAPVVISNIPAHREAAGYLPQGRVMFIDVDCTLPMLAQAVQTALHQGRADGTMRGFLPTWEQAVERTLACYQSTVRGDWKVAA